jgi:hypothetical protein
MRLINLVATLQESLLIINLKHRAHAEFLNVNSGAKRRTY